MNFVPKVPRIPLPDDEPVPAHTWPPNPEPYEQRAGDLQVGGYAHTVWLDRNRKLPERKQPYGFVAPDG